MIFRFDIESIIQKEKQCYICHSPYVEEHHIFFGTANRKLSEKYGLKVWLCPEHHRGRFGVHHFKYLDDVLKDTAREKFEETYPWNFQRLFYGDGIEVADE